MPGKPGIFVLSARRLRIKTPFPRLGLSEKAFNFVIGPILAGSTEHGKIRSYAKKQGDSCKSTQVVLGSDAFDKTQGTNTPCNFGGTTL